jgi:inhibitor of the pro-sigma K processing machinery
MGNIVPYAAAAAALFVIIACARSSLKPLKKLVSIAFNSCLGFAGLVAANHFGAYIGVTLGVNLLNALTLGVFGIPGFGLLLMLKWLYSF